jgi:hypothetical protein
MLEMAAWGALALPAAASDEGWVLLDAELTARRVELERIEPGRVHFREGSLLRTESAERIVAIIGPERASAAEPEDAAGLSGLVRMLLRGGRAGEAGVLELVDGQRLAGEPAAGPESGEMIAWKSVVFGDLEVPLDAARRVVTGGSGAARVPDSPAGVEDVLVLRSGDALRGLVTGVGTRVRIETELGVVEPALAQVAGLVLANPQREPAGVRVYLRDGTVVQVSSMRTTPAGELEMTLEGGWEADSPAESPTAALPAGKVALKDVLGVSYDAGRLRGLASLELRSVEPLADRRWTPAPRMIDWGVPAALGAAPIEMPGPMRATWSLPTGARRVGMVAVLPERMWGWGECDVVVYEVDRAGSRRELGSSRLDPGQPRFEFAAALGAAGEPDALVVEVRAGELGAIQDEVVLMRALVLTGGG